MRRRFDELIFVADPPAQVDRPGYVGDKIVGTPLHQESILFHGLEHAAKVSARLEQDHLQPRSNFAQPMRSGQARNSAAEHSHAFADRIKRLGGVHHKRITGRSVWREWV